MNTLSCTLGFAGYPCGENPINIVSLSLATAGLALVMVSSHMMCCIFWYISLSNIHIYRRHCNGKQVFWLVRKVCVSFFFMFI